MEFELIAEEIPEEESNTYAIDDNYDDYSNFEGETCGICAQTVIDRGVLDCCQHWFCFTCIDNWATVTNLCPLCQMEFQLITCVPVFDTIGNDFEEDDSSSRDEEWSIEGKNSTLSFPSYYIDENAVVCLDGDECKIRSGSAVLEEGSNHDTSIACDSCDIWYHAFCVGFDPEGDCENSWLCPRCLSNKTPKVTDEVSISRPSQQNSLENVSTECLVEAGLSRKVSVSVADAGETAIVVSLVDGNQSYEESTELISTLNNSQGVRSNPPSPSSLSSISALEMLPNSERKGLELSLSQNHSFGISSCEAVINDSKITTAIEATEEPKSLEGLAFSSIKKSAEPFYDEPREPGLDLHLSLTMSLMPDNTTAKIQAPVPVPEKSSSRETHLPAETVVPYEKETESADSMKPEAKREKILVNTGAKRKHTDFRNRNDGGSTEKTETKLSVKKMKAEGNSQLYQSKEKTDGSISISSLILSRPTKVFKDEKMRCIPKKEDITADIMDIVHGTERKKHSGPSILADVTSREKQNMAGLRVKKIMRRVDDSEDSKVLVEKLRKEIREAVRSKSSKELGQNLFDPKLLAAFRAVVSGPSSDTKKSQLDMKAKKLLLQKGKVRENLTKKIYGIGGRRKRAWTRDCEVEFWKHRCSKTSKPEKVQTLKSVLALLRNDSDSTETKHTDEGEAKTSILSRLYLADASVMPRKGDIKPVSAIKATTEPLLEKEQNPTDKASTSASYSSDVHDPKHEKSVQVVVPPPKAKTTVAGRIGEPALSKKCPNKYPQGPSISTVSGSKGPLKKETVSKPEDIKSDKRKWALEVLARKNAAVGKNATQEKGEDNALLRGNYPLLAQIPKDMRPTLAAIHHNKIPMSVRQAQLFRLTEHFLKRANQSVICRSAETELAVADAINIEKEIANRCSSKLVYVNLCSQELLRKSTNSNSGGHTESLPSPSFAATDEEVENKSSYDADVDKALRNTGLVSDSPPNSPHQLVKEIEEDGLKNVIEDNEPDNVFEMDSQSELDIYADFEYNLEDDDFIGASALKMTEVRPDESKLKVVFSSLNPGESNGTQDISRDEGTPDVKASNSSSRFLEYHMHDEDSTINNPDAGLLQNASNDDGDGEPSLAECEELYGPDKEPLVEKYPEMNNHIPDPSSQSGMASQSGSVSLNENSEASGNLQPHSVPESSIMTSQRNEGVLEEKTSISENCKQENSCNHVSKKVEAYIKEHIRPLCKSGVITVEQYRWAVGRTTEKVMKYHSKEKNASFLIREGEKVKKLAEQYVEAAQKKAKE